MQYTAEKILGENNNKRFYNMNYCVESIFAVHPFFFSDEPRKMTVKCAGHANEYFMGLTESGKKEWAHIFFCLVISERPETKTEEKKKNGDQDKLGARNENERKKNKL